MDVGAVGLSVVVVVEAVGALAVVEPLDAAIADASSTGASSTTTRGATTRSATAGSATAGGAPTRDATVRLDGRPTGRQRQENTRDQPQPTDTKRFHELPPVREAEHQPSRAPCFGPLREPKPVRLR